MGKGFPRSLKRGPELRQEIVKKTIVISGTVDVTGVAATVDAGEIVIGGFPEGNILLLGAVSYVAIDADDASMLINWAGDYAIGTVPNSNDVDVGDAGEANIIPSTAIAADTDTKVSLETRGASTAALAGTIFDNTDGSLELNLNILIDDNFITDTEVATLTASGVLHLAYIVLGDD